VGVKTSQTTNKFAFKVRQQAVRWFSITIGIIYSDGECGVHRGQDRLRAADSYKWLKKAYANTGRQQVSLQVCDKVKALKREVGHLGQANQICAGPPHI
jgi:hypothetical protein